MNVVPLPLLTSPKPVPGADEVHLWFADLDGERPDRFLPSLSDEELGRAGRYHFPKDRERFLLRRGLLRALLAGYTCGDARELRFCRGTNGKPFLAGPRPAGIHFNCSCSGTAALFAFARAGQVGVDLERMRPFPDKDRIAARFFSPPERNALSRLDGEERATAFFRYWTAKEAFVKATGEGLSRPLDTFAVAPGRAPAPSAVRERDGSPAGWSLRTFLVRGGYAAAVVLKGSGFSIRPFTCAGPGDGAGGWTADL
jgi:4'-phosphopantetheinyl transferase